MFGLVYSVIAYLGFLIVFAYLACFSAGVLVPKHVDSGALVGTPTFLLVNLALLVLFGLQHSVMARSSFKRTLTRVVPPALERATYVLLADVAVALLMWQWRPQPAVLWQVESPALRIALWTVCAIGWLGVPGSSLLIDHLHLVGLRQAWAGFRRSAGGQKGFVTPLFYRFVRHPMMSFLLLGLWVTPHMTVGHLLLALGMSAYVVVGVHFEERSLSAELGADYLRYQARTPRFLPGLAPVTEAPAVPDRGGTDAARSEAPVSSRTSGGFA